MLNNAPSLSHDEVEELLDLDDLIDAVGRALADLTSGRATVPHRTRAVAPDGVLLSMTAQLSEPPVLVGKLLTLFPGNTELPTHQAAVLAFDGRDGRLLGSVDGTAITTLRTAATSALSVRLLARRDARVLAIVGTGVQARAHALLVARAMQIDELRIAGRNLAKAQALAAELVELGLPARAIDGVREAVETADVVCVTTHAHAPVVERSWLAPGTHVVTVAYYGDLDPAIVVEARLFVETRKDLFEPYPIGAMDLSKLAAEGIIGPDDLHAELGEVIAGAASGRADDEELTLFRSIGSAVEDAAAAVLVLDAWRARQALVAP